MLYYVKVQNFNLQQAYRLYTAGRTVSNGSDCLYFYLFILHYIDFSFTQCSTNKLSYSSIISSKKRWPDYLQIKLSCPFEKAYILYK